MQTSEHLTGDLFGDELEFSPEDSPVSRFRSQAAGAAKRTSDFSGLNLFESSGKSGLSFASLKTYLASETSRLTGCYKSWRRQATPQGRSWWVLMTSGPLTEGSASGLWPTPTAQDGSNVAGVSQEARNSPPLNAIVRQWPTPRANKTEGYSSPQFRPELAETAAAFHLDQEQTGAESPQSSGLSKRLNSAFVTWLMNYPADWFDGVEMPGKEPRSSKD